LCTERLSISTICPLLRLGARISLMYTEKKDSVSEEPWMLIDAPIPESVIEQMSLTFLPPFLGALPKALSALGALA
jgi:hypothetical protein